MAPLTLRSLVSEPDAERSLHEVLPWVVEAGNPYLGWHFGPDTERAVERWMRRPSSELAIQRVTALERMGEVVGGFIAMDGRTLRTCRLADTLASVSGSDPATSSADRPRSLASAGLFPQIDPEEFYLSKLGVLPSHRGQGLGRWLGERFLDRGREDGFNRFRLEVASTNERALSMYRSFGFDVVGEATLPGTDISYLWMALQP